MNVKGRRVLLCDCERTMALDGKKLATALGADGDTPIHHHLCRAGIEAYANALEGGEPLLVACTQEAPLFREIAEDQGRDAPLDFANIRERAGWHQGKGDATPKIAALLAEACVEGRPSGQRTLVSDGMCLVYGAGQQALDVARQLANRLNVTLLLSDSEDVVPPSIVDVPIYQGRISAASGHLGAFEVTVDGYAPVLPSSKDGLQFMMARDGAKSRCAVIFDMSGNDPLLPGEERREGYLRVDPNYPAGIFKAMFEASDLVGEFEKPLYVGYNADICAHGRSGKTGCSNCIDACPLSAIQPDGDIVIIDHEVCGGCGACSSSCPTGAVSYAYPRREELIARIRTLIGTFLACGGTRPVLLIHDSVHGGELIGAVARFGKGLPVNILPLSVHAATEIGHDVLAAALAAGAEHVVLVTSPERRDELAPLEGQSGLVETLLGAMGFGEEPRIHILCESDPDAVETALYGLAKLKAPKPANFEAVGSKREIARAALAKLNEQAPQRRETVPLAAGAPYGRIRIDTEGCTLCLACVGACPAGALLDNPDLPQVRFIEAACVQCGLCTATCPEKVITLEPRYTFTPDAMTPQVLHEEEPFPCVRCGKPIAARSTIERISAQLAGKHAMFMTADRAKLIEMCDDCRVVVQAEAGDELFAFGSRPMVRTTEDYFNAEKAAASNGDAALKAEDFLKDD